MFYLVYPFGIYNNFTLWFGNYFPYIILHYGLVFFHHSFYPFFILNNYFKTSRFFVYNITHQRHITRKWLWPIALPSGAFCSTIPFCFLNNLMGPSWLSLVGDIHVGWFLGIQHIMLFRNLVTKSENSFIDSTTLGATTSSYVSRLVSSSKFASFMINI